jgi:hypothetical protein
MLIAEDGIPLFTESSILLRVESYEVPQEVSLGAGRSSPHVSSLYIARLEKTTVNSEFDFVDFYRDLQELELVPDPTEPVLILDRSPAIVLSEPGIRRRPVSVLRRARRKI